MWSLPKVYKRAQSEDTMEYRRVVRRKLGKVLEMAVESDQEEMARKELHCAKKTSYVS
jgi:phosphoribosylformylglycinamidine (FGAM) synthase PurS component